MAHDPTNIDRATWAADALRTFREATLTDAEDALGDLLCDLMHWADVVGENFAETLLGAQNTYAAEIAEEKSRVAL